MTKGRAYILADELLTVICGNKRMMEHGAIIFWGESGPKVVSNRPNFGDKFIRRNLELIVGVYDQLVSVDMIAQDLMAFSKEMSEE